MSLPLTVCMVTYGGAGFIAGTISRVMNRTAPPFTLSVWDNASDAVTRAVLEGLRRRYAPALTVRWHPENVGYTQAVNDLVAGADPDGLVAILNSDVWVPPGWNVPLAAVLAADPICLVAGPERQENRGACYLEGCCVMMRAAEAQAWGPLDRGICPFMYWDDPDLAMRCVQAGRTQVHVELPGFVHDRCRSRPDTDSAAERPHGVPDVLGQAAISAQRFYKRWAGPDKIVAVGPAAPGAHRDLLYRRGGSRGDVMSTRPAIRRVAAKFPGREIAVTTAFPDLIMDMPEVARLYPWGGTRLADFPTDHGTETHPGRDLITAFLIDVEGEDVEVTIADRVLGYRPNMAERRWAAARMPPGPFLALCPHSASNQRSYPLAADLCRLLEAAYGWPVVLLTNQRGPENGDRWDVAGGTTFGQAAAVIERAEMLVTVDAAHLHTAASVGTPTVGIFGATLPSTRLHEGQHGVTARLDCVGCLTRWDVMYPHHHEMCLREPWISTRETSPACMRSLRPSRVLAAAVKRLPPPRVPVPLLLSGQAAAPRIAVTVAGELCAHQGFGRSFRTIVLSFMAGGDQVAVLRSGKWDPRGADPKLLALFDAPPLLTEALVLFQRPELWPDTGAYRMPVGFVMTEGSRFPESWVPRINRECAGVMVLCRHNVDAARRSGITVPIGIAPHACLPPKIDPRAGPPGKRDGVFRFGALADFVWWRKGLDLMIEGFSRAFPDQPDVRLVLQGYRPADWQGLIRDARIEVAVEEVVSNRARGHWYHGLDAYVSTSRGETWGMPITEAMASGLPVIAPDWGGPAEIVDAEVGISLPIRGMVWPPKSHPYLSPGRTDMGWYGEPDPHGVAAAMRALYDDWRVGGERCRRLGEAGRRRVRERYSLAAMRAAMVQFLLGLEPRSG